MGLSLVQDALWLDGHLNVIWASSGGLGFTLSQDRPIVG